MTQKLSRRKFLQGMGATSLVALCFPILGRVWISCAERFPEAGEFVDIDFRHPEYSTKYLNLKTVKYRGRYYNWRLSDEELSELSANTINDKFKGHQWSIRGWQSPGKGILVLEDKYAYWSPSIC